MNKNLETAKHKGEDNVNFRKKTISAYNNLLKDKIKIRRTITRTGNSFSINIPPILIQKMGLTKKNVLMEEDGDRIIIYRDKTIKTGS